MADNNEKYSKIPMNPPIKTEFEWTLDKLIAWSAYYEKNKNFSYNIGSYLMDRFKESYCITQPEIIYPEGIVAFEQGNSFDEQVLDYQNYCYLHLGAITPPHKIMIVKNDMGEFHVGDKMCSEIGGTEYEILSFQIVKYGNINEIIAVAQEGTLNLSDLKKSLNEKQTVVTPCSPSLPEILPRQMAYEKFQMNRLDELGEAIERYTQARKSIPTKWIEEYNKLLIATKSRNA